MDIHKLLDTVDKLNTKISDLDKIEVAKKQVIEDVSREIAKSCQLLEEKAKGLEKTVENKLNVLKKLDDELIKSRALLAKMNNSQNSNHSNITDNNIQSENHQAAVKAAAKSDKEPEISSKERKLRAEIMNSSLEDFIAQRFQEEYKVKYPESDNFRLTDKDFETVLFRMREKAKKSNNLPEIIDEYLSSYSQTLHGSQVKMLEQEKSKSVAK